MTLEIILHCESFDGEKFTLRDPCATMPPPGGKFEYQFPIPKKTTVRKFEVWDPDTKETLSRRSGQAFVSAGTFTVQLYYDPIFDPKPTIGERDERRIKSVRNFKRSVSRARQTSAYLRRITGHR